jgi:branched-chain amino acid transport system permease protein
MDTATLTIVTLVNSVVLSSLYILVALGFALLLSIMGIFNFAHGSIYMMGAFLTYAAGVYFGVNQWLALVIAIIAMGLFGLFLERFCLRPFGSKGFSVIVMSIALTLILENAVSLTMGGNARQLPAFISGAFKIGEASISYERGLSLVIGLVLLMGMTYFIQRTKMGQQMLAISQDREGSALQGININRTAAIATVIACILATLSGTLMSSLFVLDPYMGDNILLKAIEIVILSGIGSFGGILVGGLIVGFMDAALPIITTPLIAQSVTISVLIIILLIRPKGLFGYELF